MAPYGEPTDHVCVVVVRDEQARVVEMERLPPAVRIEAVGEVDDHAALPSR